MMEGDKIEFVDYYDEDEQEVRDILKRHNLK